MQAYLDNSATTRCSEGVRDIVVKVMMEDFGNPSSRHDKGMEAEKYLREARMEIAATLKADEKEIYFTSGGTESDNWALIGTAMANKRAGKHIITTAIEHAAVIQPMIYLQEQGFEVSYIPVDRYGRIDLQKFSDAIREDTILVSTMYVNNEIDSGADRRDREDYQRKKSKGTLACGCNPGLWKVPYLSEKTWH